MKSTIITTILSMLLAMLMMLGALAEGAALAEETVQTIDLDETTGQLVNGEAVTVGGSDTVEITGTVTSVGGMGFGMGQPGKMGPRGKFAPGEGMEPPEMDGLNFKHPTIVVQNQFVQILRFAQDDRFAPLSF